MTVGGSWGVKTSFLDDPNTLDDPYLKSTLGLEITKHIFPSFHAYVETFS